MPPKPEIFSGAVATGITRRSFVKAGGALFVSLAMPRGLYAKADDGHFPPDQNQLDPGKLASWLEIRSDGTILARTGRAEIGTGMSAFYPQMIAEELRVQPDCITLLMGDTDKTPDGGYSAGFLSGAANVRKVAAYTYQALLGLASTQLGVPTSALTVTDGMVSGGGKSISYGKLIEGHQLDLKIPVTGSPLGFAPAGSNSVAGLDWAGMDGLVVAGDPPMKPVSEYKVIGTSFPMPGIRDKVTGQTQWSCDVMLPGMLHARMVRPPTMGSTLISVGEVDKKRFPTAEVVRKGNLVAVVSPNEWEAVSALRSVAGLDYRAARTSPRLCAHIRGAPPMPAKGMPRKSRLLWKRLQKRSRQRMSNRISSTPRLDRFSPWPMCAAMELRPSGPRQGTCKRRANGSQIFWVHPLKRWWCTG
jgi:nicotinate dehydrogenase subunit B